MGFKHVKDVFLAWGNIFYVYGCSKNHAWGLIVLGMMVLLISALFSLWNSPILLGQFQTKCPSDFQGLAMALPIMGPCQTIKQWENRSSHKSIFKLI